MIPPVLGGFLGEVGSWSLVIMGVGLLIFIHEAGHFLAAKWAGVRVLAFSLGFGPEMFGFTRGPTRYRIAWIPLGGYVKMSGENELPEGGYAPDDFPSKPVWKRFIIMIAGVVMNAVLGFLLFGASFLAGMDAVPAVVGSVGHGGPAWEAGLRPGDRLAAADGRRLLAFEDLVFATMEGRTVSFTVERDGKTLEIPISPLVVEGAAAPAIGVSPPVLPEVQVQVGGEAEAAGFRNGDRIVEVEGVPAGLSDLEDGDVFRPALFPDGGPLEITVERGGERVRLAFPPARIPDPKVPAPKGAPPPPSPRIWISPLRRVVEFVRGGGGAAAAGWRAGDRPEAVAGNPVRGAASFLRAAMAAPAGAPVTVSREGGAIDLPLPEDPAARLALLRDLRFALPESKTAVEVQLTGPLSPDGTAGPSPAEAAGIPNGARITAVAGMKVATFTDLAKRIQEAKGEPLTIAWSGPGTEKGGEATVTPAAYPTYSLGGLLFSTVTEPVAASGPGEAAVLAFDRCVQTTRNIVSTMTGIFSGRVAKDNLGGPVAIAQITKRSTEAGAGRFFSILAMLSINLMFLNVLPIPLLDGGQILLLGVEAVTRKPPKEWVVAAGQWLGLALLLSLMIFVTFNDIARIVGR